VPESSIPEPLLTKAQTAIEDTSTVAPEPEALPETLPEEADIKPITNLQSGSQPLADFVGELENPPQPSSTDAIVPGMQEQAQVEESVDNMGASASMENKVVEDTTPINGLNGTVHEPAVVAASMEDKVMENATPVNGLDGTVDEPAVANTPAVDTAAADFPKLESEDVSMADVAPTTVKNAREREDDEDGGPSAKRARTEEVAPAEVNGGSAIAEETPVPTTEQPAAPPAPVNVPTFSTTLTYQPPSLGIDFGAMTESQYKIIEGGMRNLKKSRNAVMFQKPVDPVALNLPRYFEIITHPMDLSTMERKIKTREYKSVNDYVLDFWTMVTNSATFNGATHAVTLSGVALMQQLDAQLRKASRPGDSGVVATEPAPKKKKQTPIPTESKQRHQSRPSLPKPLPPPPLPIAKEETYALDTNGMPQIRRMSTSDGRPKREIKAPARELPYSAKPKKKKYQAELKYCQEIIDEFKKPKWAPSVYAFSAPVDPVALNIPTYRSIVKKPMDLGTMQEKLNRGEYENCKEFEADFRLMCDNCYKFNGKDHIVSKMAQDLEAHLTSLLSKKNDWIAKHAPRSSPQSPDPASDSEAEDEEEEEEEDMDQFDAINKQMAALTEQLMALQQKGKLGKSKDKKSKSSGKASKKNSLGGGSLPVRSEKKSKSKVTKPLKPVTSAQKEEISTKIGTLTEQEIGQAANIIKSSLRRAGKVELANRADDEMEFEIDEIPDDGLHELLKLVRKATQTEEEVVADTDYRPVKTVVPANSGKSRKNKPMSKHEQEARINELKGKLNDFKNRGSGSSPPGKLIMPTESDGPCTDISQAGHAAAESSGDEEESGSESEEE